MKCFAGHGRPPDERAPRMYQESGLAWLERQAEVAEDLVAERQAAAHYVGPGQRPCRTEAT